MTNLADKIQDTNQARKTGTDLTTKHKTVFEAVRELQPQFAIALAGNIDPARFVRVAVTSLRSNAALAKCDQASLLGALMICAQLGLEPGGPLGHAYLVPYKNQVTFIVGYKGYIALALRSDQIASVKATPVYDGDHFKVEYGLHEDIVHHPDATNHDDEHLTHTYAVARYKDPAIPPTFVVLTKAEIDKYRSRSAAKTSGPWVTDYQAMALKTAVRRLATWLPMATDIVRAASADEQTPTRIHVDPDDFIDLEPDDDPPAEEPAAEPTSSATK